MFTSATFLYEKPEVINEISFSPKQAIENHILMAGDSAGLITPLCGNGMAMAIRGAKLASERINTFLLGQVSRTELEKRYQHDWNQSFAYRLWLGRTVQRVFGKTWLTENAVRTLSFFKPVLHQIIQQTHGSILTG